MKRTIIFLITTITTLTFFSCNKDEGSKPEMPNINIIDISGESNWDYCVLGTKDYYFIKANGSMPEAVLFHSTDAGYEYSIFFNNNGYLDKVFVDDYIVSFKNPNGNKIDIGIIYPNGNIEILREVETDFNWDNFQLKSACSIKAWSDVVRWTGRIVSGVPCGLSIASSLASSGAGTPLAVWTCGNYLLGLSSDIMENELEIHNGYTDIIDIYGTLGAIESCNGTNIRACAIELTSQAFYAWANHLEEIEENRKDDVQLIDAALEYGYGDVQITLTWDNLADLDLHVIDPNGEEIYWANQYSFSNGVLDVDDINGEGPENIYWPENEAPIGNYEVYIHMYPWVESDYISYTGNSYYPNISNYTVLVNAFGRTKKFTGSISFNEIIHITDFDQTGIKNTSLKSTSNITTNKDKKNTKILTRD